MFGKGDNNFGNEHEEWKNQDRKRLDVKDFMRLECADGNVHLI